MCWWMSINVRWRSTINHHIKIIYNLLSFFRYCTLIFEYGIQYFFVHGRLWIRRRESKIKGHSLVLWKIKKVNPSNLCVILAKYFIIRCATKCKGTTCNAKKSNAMKIYPKIFFIVFPSYILYNKLCNVPKAQQ